MRSNKKECLKEVDLEQDDLDGVSYFRHELFRVYAVSLTFKGVDFRQAVISECYFRNCVFIDCDFRGARIKSTNFQGAEFSDCKFSYAEFSSTDIGIDPLSKNLPQEENLKQRLAQNLRANYASLGDYDGVNFAIRIELSATKEHYRKAAFSREPYYRNKKEYNGYGRVFYLVKFFRFWVLDKLWGNGEHPGRMLVSVPILLFLFASAVSYFSDSSLAVTIPDVSKVFVVGGDAVTLSASGVITVTLFRYVVLGLFVSSLVKRISRR